VSKRIVHIRYFAVMLVVVAGTLYFTGLVGTRFYPTFEQAFARHETVFNRRVGELLFVDEHETTVTVFHHGASIYASHFLREVQEDGTRYACVGMSQGVGPFLSVQSQRDNQRQIFTFIGETGAFARIHQRNYEVLGRRPLYGTFHGEEVHNLSINGIPVEHVIFVQETMEHPMLGIVGTENLYIWYFSDFPVITGSAENIVISFERG